MGTLDTHPDASAVSCSTGWESQDNMTEGHQCSSLRGFPFLGLRFDLAAEHFGVLLVSPSKISVKQKPVPSDSNHFRTTFNKSSAAWPLRESPVGRKSEIRLGLDLLVESYAPCHPLMFQDMCFKLTTACACFQGRKPRLENEGPRLWALCILPSCIQGSIQRPHHNALA